MKLNLGCGGERPEGYTNVDGWPGCKPDILLDLFRFPWPWEDSSVEEIICSHILEHVPHQVEGFPGDGLVGWMNECWRILKPGGLLHVAWPHHQSDCAFVDPTHTRFITQDTFQYGNRHWRILNLRNADYAGFQCDFSYEGEGGRLFSHRDYMKDLPQEEKQRIVTREWNVAFDLQGVLFAHKPVRE